jgi:hypothetical protein
MRRLTTALVVGTLLGIGSSQAVTAQSPSPGPLEVDQRIEVPQAGIGVAFPADWTVDIRTVPLSDRSELPGPEVEASILVNAYLPYEFEGCRVSLWGSLGMTPGEFAQWNSPSDLEVKRIILPVGEVFRVSLIKDDPVEPDIELFILSVEEDTLMLTCLGDDPPLDRWLSIAETLEFLPEE